MGPNKIQIYKLVFKVEHVDTNSRKFKRLTTKKLWEIYAKQKGVLR